MNVKHHKVTFPNRFGIPLVANTISHDAPFYVKDYYDYYKTKHGYTKEVLSLMVDGT